MAVLTEPITPITLVQTCRPSGAGLEYKTHAGADAETVVGIVIDLPPDVAEDPEGIAEAPFRAAAEHAEVLLGLEAVADASEPVWRQRHLAQGPAEVGFAGKAVEEFAAIILPVRERAHSDVLVEKVAHACAGS